MRNIYKILAFAVLTFPFASTGQDYHFSQFDALVPSFQPGLTGVFTDFKYRAATQYRNQWRPLATKPFSTFALAYDMPINKRWGAGGYLINYDGAKVFNAFNLVLSGSYKIMDPGQEEHLLTAGLQMGIIYKNINNSDLLFESQYDDGLFNSALPSNEGFNRMSKLIPEFNVGFYYEWIDENNMYHPYAGLSLFHITSPNESMLISEGVSRVPRRFLLNAGCKLDISDEVKLDVKILNQNQGKANGFTIGAGGSYYLAEQEIDLKLGLYIRAKDAFVIATGLSYDDLTFMLSYDITTSGLKEFNGGKGALEFTMIYRPSKASKSSRPASPSIDQDL